MEVAVDDVLLTTLTCNENGKKEQWAKELFKINVVVVVNLWLKFC